MGIAPTNRIGLLDRKFRIISENTTNNEEWLEWSVKAMEHTYGFELQGDNLLIARENVLFTYFDYYHQRYNVLPDIELIKKIATIISWNLWQMDGLKLVVPFSCHDTVVGQQQLSFEEGSIFNSVEKHQPCPGCLKGNKLLHNGVYCNIKDWDTGVVDSFSKITTNQYGKI